MLRDAGKKSYASQVILILLLMLSQGSHAHSSPCIDLKEFVNAFSFLDSYQDRQNLIDWLSPQDIACLYKQAAAAKSEALGSPSVTLKDFAPDNSNSVTQFHGRSSLPVSRTFEKHFFYITNAHGQRKFYGYNYSPTMQWLGGPGFLAVDVSKDGKYFTGDYTQDFVNDIPQDQFLEKTNRKVSVIKNNTHNLVYGNLIDRFYMIHPDLIINEGLNPQKDGSLKHLVYFILLRKP